MVRFKRNRKRRYISGGHNNVKDSSISVDKPSDLKIALENRTFEIQMFWQRSNYFLVLITAIGVAVFSVKQDLLALVMSIFAAITSYYWYKTNLGSKFWQESWEVEVISLAKIDGIASFERSTTDIVQQVQKSFENSSAGKGRIHRAIDNQILKKPSVSYYMIMLSICSMALWVVVTLIIGWRWITMSKSVGSLYITCPV